MLNQTFLCENITVNSTNNCEEVFNYENFWQACQYARNYGSIIVFALGLLINTYSFIFFIKDTSLIHKCTMTLYILGLTVSSQMKLLAELPFEMFLNYKIPEGLCNLIIWARYSFSEISSWILIFLLIDSAVTSRLKTITQISNKTINANYWRGICVISVFFVFFIKNFTFLILNALRTFDFFTFIKLKNCGGSVPEINDFIYLREYAWFFFGFQLIYSYVPVLKVIIFNTLLIFTLYEVKYKALLNSSQERQQKVNQLERYVAVICQMSIVFSFFTLPYEVFTSVFNFKYLQTSEKLLYYEGVQNILKLLQLISYDMYFFCFASRLKLVNYKKIMGCFVSCINVFLCCNEKKRFDLTDRKPCEHEVFSLKVL